MEEEREEMERIELDIEKDIYEYIEKLAKEEGMTIEKYVWKWIKGIMENDKVI
jgi:hypothetical protein